MTTTLETEAPPSGWGYQSLLIRQIRRDGGTQARVGLNEDTVQDYAELMREQRWDFQSRQRPIVLYDGTVFWLADGFHRIEAAQRAGLSDYPVEVLSGTQRDAILRAAGANAQHGLRRTNADKRRAVELLLRDEEWRQWSDRKIAEACAVDHKTVADVRRSLSGEIPQIQTRTVERSGTTYQMTPAAPKPKIPETPPAPGPNLASVAADRLARRGWFVRRHGDLYRLQLGGQGDIYETDAAGVRAAARILEEQPDLSPDQLWEAVATLDDAPPALRVAFRHSRDRAETDLDDALHDRLVALGYTWESAAITPDGRWHHVITAYNRNLIRNDGTRMRIEQLEALAQNVVGQRDDPNKADPKAPTPPATWTQTCVRCGKGRDLYRQLTSYEAGLVPEYPGRAVTLCSICIPELLRARKQAAERLAPPEKPAADDIPHLPPDFGVAQKRAAAIGLHIAMDMHGLFSIKNAGGSGVDQIAEWDSLLRHLVNHERAAAEIAAERKPSPPAPLPIELQKRLIAAGAAIYQDGTVLPPRGTLEAPWVMTPDDAEQALARWAKLETAPAVSASGVDWNAIARASYHLGATSSTAEAQVMVGTVIRLLAAPDPAVMIGWLLTEAAALVGDHLEDLAEQLDDAEYEALARLLRPAVPTLESEVAR